MPKSKATGHDWIKIAYGAEIKGGTGKVDLNATVRVDGTVEVGLRSQQILIIDGNGEIAKRPMDHHHREKAVLMKQYERDHIQNSGKICRHRSGNRICKAG
ncbi:hypothetical protein MASR2M70_13500 [Bacillota bacterium]